MVLVSNLNTWEDYRCPIRLGVGPSEPVLLAAQLGVSVPVPTFGSLQLEHK